VPSPTGGAWLQVGAPWGVRPVKVTVYFADGERLEGDSGAMTLSKMGFPVLPSEGNSDVTWVSLSAIKYVLLHAGNVESSEEGDPRERRGLPKVVIRFQDGEVIRTYRDDNWAQEDEGFKMRIWDPQLRMLTPALVSMHHVKAIFMVKEWDSRSPGQKLLDVGRAPREKEAPVSLRTPAAAHNGEKIEKLAREYRPKLARIRDDRLSARSPEEFVAGLRHHLAQLLTQDQQTLSSNEFHDLSELLLRNAFKFGPLDSLLTDPTVAEIMVNAWNEVYVERRGRLEKSKQHFHDTGELLDVIRKMAASVGRRIDESNPMVDARLGDGSRINAVIPPAAVDGPILTIRKFTKSLVAIGDLLAQQTLDMKMAMFLQHAVLGRANLLISGGTGSGKTTTLNVLAGLIPHDQRVVTIEDTAELQIKHPHVLRLEYRPPNVEGRGELTIRHLLRNSLRMRPDRLIVGEVRGAEALEMLQAMNTGHEGSMSTIHSNSAVDAMSRLETMVLSASIDLPLDAVRPQIASAVNLVLHQVRMADGTRRIVQIAEMLGYRDNQPVMNDLFVYDDEADTYRPTGVRPGLQGVKVRGIQFPDLTPEP
jgi:pilus assembly protein CpaF